ncbi:EAL domain-containing protein [Shewanella sp. 202IG2-18]|uniref:EAL domain-containing protein n=1 Tax=Parashewanella hymeniacidonis TaxID=2807618 RepID=UPI00195FADF3|nr:EAL domain-containing protein [Parashewanella hymeniacidonis]MBM7072239.1 EAL domain-containing protein [Parashewanella hymeniacidonis]
MIRFFFKSLFAFWLSAFLFSQVALALTSIQRVISSSDGLDAVVNDIDFDGQGFAWFATEQGLFRATNTHVERIDLSNSEPPLQDQYFSKVRSLGMNKVIVDAFQGLHYFNYQDYRFAPLSTLAAFKELKLGRLAQLLSLDDQQHILLTAPGQVIYFSSSEKQAEKAFFLPVLKKDNYKDIVLFEEQLLIATEKKIGFLNESDEVRWLSIPKTVGKIHQLLVSGNRVWIAADGGFFEVSIDPESTTLELMTILSAPSFSISIDDKQKLWLATKVGVMSFNTSTNELVHVTKSHIKEKNFAVDKKIIIDKNNLIWVTGYQNQVAILTDKTDFLVDTISSSEPYYLSEQNTWSIWSEDSTVYTGTSNQVTIIDRVTKSSKVLSIIGLNASESIYEIKSLDAHNLLLSTTDGLFVLNKDTQYSQPFNLWTGGTESLTNKTVYQSAFEPHSQQWWFATSAGIYRWRVGSREILQANVGSDKGLSFRSIFVDDNGTLWFGGESAFGFYVNDVFTAIDKKHFGVDVLPIISHIVQVDENRLWLGSTYHGGYEYNRMTKQLSPIDFQSTQYCQSIYFFQKINQQILLGCRNGVILNYQVGLDQFTIYDAQDGLIAEELNEGAIFYLPKQGLFIGSPEGIMFIKPEKLSKRISSDNVFVSSVSTYYHDTYKVNLLPQSDLTIQPQVGLVSLQVSSQNYLQNRLKDVRYRLIGNNIPRQKKFIQLSDNAQINLSNLDSGNYTLQLISEITQQGKDAPYNFHFTVSQLWWHSEQFKTLLAFFIFIIGVLTVLRHQSQTQKFKHLNTKLIETQDRLQQALKSSDSDLWEWHINAKQLHIGNYSKIFILEREKKIYEMSQLKIHPEDQERVLSQWDEMVSGKADAFDAEYRQMAENGSWRWIRTKGRPVKYNDDGESVEVVSGIYTDVTSTRNLEEQAGLLAEAFENTSEGVVIFNENEQAVVANRAAQKLIEMPAEHLEKRSFSDVVFGIDITIAGLLVNESHWSGELEIEAATGVRRPVWLTLSQIHSKTQDTQNYVVVFSDISQRKSAEEKLRRLANFDPLTGLANRTFFSEKLLDSIQQAQRENSRLALMFMDLDRFKNINDSYGHNMGDALLIEAASRIQDSAGSHAVLSRFGGDEFVLLLPDIVNTAEVDLVAKRIHRNIEAPFRLFEREFYISTSIGVSLWPDHALHPETLIKNADLAMYHAKEDGPGNVRYFSNARNEKNLYFLRIESELRKAIQNNQLELHYQPQINILDGDSLVGMEALLRWKHPEDGYISPDVFIEVAESAGLIIEIDRWVFQNACIQISQWKKQFKSDFRVSINVSAAHFLQPDYVDTIREVMIQTGVEGKLLGLEITEGVLMKEVDQAQKHLSQLQLLGINIAIDDFGTGYSSLAYLRNFAVNSLKIDRKFIIDINQNRADQAIVTSIIELARNLRLKVVAEGIETYDQMEHLIGRGCYLMQGFYFAKPLPQKDMERYLEHSLHTELEQELV